MTTVACCVSFEAFQGFIQTFVRPEAISTWQDTSYLNPEEVINRVYGTLKPYNPNLFGGYLVAALPSLIAVFLGKFLQKNTLLSVVFGCFSLLSLYVLFQTGCRGAYLGLFGIILIFVCILYHFFAEK